MVRLNGDFACSFPLSTFAELCILIGDEFSIFVVFIGFAEELFVGMEETLLLAAAVDDGEAGVVDLTDDNFA